MLQGGSGVTCTIYSSTSFLGWICLYYIEVARRLISAGWDILAVDDLDHDLSDLSVNGCNGCSG